MNEIQCLTGREDRKREKEWTIMGTEQHGKKKGRANVEYDIKGRDSLTKRKRCGIEKEVKRKGN